MYKTIIDPVENTKEYKDIVSKVDEVVKQKLSEKGVQVTRGYIHMFWELKKQVLKEEYKIDWKTPAEMNPNVKFD